MKKILLLLIISILTQSCKINETPEFVGVACIDVLKYNQKSITISSDLIFHNPNHLGGVLQASEIEVYVNEINMGNINSADFDVPAQDKFTVPVEFEFPYDKIFQEKENVLLNVLNTLTDKKINVRYKGTITYKLNVFSYDYPLDYSQEISLRKKR